MNSLRILECNLIQVNMGFVQYSVNHAVLTSQEAGHMDVFKVKDIQQLSTSTESQGSWCVNFAVICGKYFASLHSLSTYL